MEVFWTVLAILVLAVIIFLIVRASKKRKATELEAILKVQRDLEAEWQRKDRAKTAEMRKPASVTGVTRNGTSVGYAQPRKVRPAGTMPKAPTRSSSRNSYPSPSRSSSYHDDGTTNALLTGAIIASTFDSSPSHDTSSSSSSSYDSGSSSSSYDSGSSFSGGDSGSF